MESTPSQRGFAVLCLMFAMKYVLKPAILGRTPEIIISEQEYLQAKRCRRHNYEAFEIELAFDFVVLNYIEIEKYIAEHLVLDMAGQTRTQDAIRAQQWGFIRTLNNWLASMSFWRDLTRSRLVSICGRGTELDEVKATHNELQENEFVYAFIFHLRNFSQHGGFPVTNSSSGARWNEERSQLKFLASYNLNYEQISTYFEKGGVGAKNRKEFGKRIQDYSNGKPFDLKPIIRKSMGVLGLSMDRIRSAMVGSTSQNEKFVLGLIEKFRTTHPDTSIVGLSVMPLDGKNIVPDKADIISVRDEFIVRAWQFRKKNNAKRLSMEKLIISSE
ncbi:MAG: hypothetical protein GY742_20280 [Hyphomicrobiales bacterium]|nr:hypothetical protein [Hyphomicrobiales bacterium]